MNHEMYYVCVWRRDMGRASKHRCANVPPPNATLRPPPTLTTNPNTNTSNTYTNMYY